MGKRFFRNFFRKNENEGEEVSMNHFKQRSVQSEESFFSNNEKEVTQMICRIMSYAFCIYPVMLLLNVINLFKFSNRVIFLIFVVGIFCTLSPLLLSKFVKNQTLMKYYTILCIITVVSVLGTEYYVGIYITYIIAPIASCLYFDKKFTTRILSISYVAFLISYFFRSFQIRDHLYPTETIWPTYIPLAAGFTIEFFVSLLFLYRLADRIHNYLVDQNRLINDMARSEMKTQLAIEATKDILFEYDVKKDTYSSNGTICDWTRKDVYLEHFKEYVRAKNWRTEDFPDTLMEFVHMPVENGDRFQKEIDISFMENGREYISWAFFEVLIIRDETGKSDTIVGKLRDITEQKIEELQAEEAKKYDALSGMYNYSSLRKVVQGMEVMYKNKTHQIMIVHIRNYDNIAECYGEVYRDFVLINVADAIKETAEGKEAYTCRLSKDAFAIYIPDCDLVDARSMRQELNDRLKEIYVGEKEENQLVYDFGYYLGSEEMDEMFKYAAQYVSQDKETESSFLNELEDSLQSENIFVVQDVKYNEVSEAHKAETAENFINNLSLQIACVKDRRSAIQMTLAHVGRFFGLSGVRIYEMEKSQKPILPAFEWMTDKKVEKAYKESMLSYQVRSFFAENFEKSRIVDNTSGAFQDFFRQFGKTPLLLEQYSSLICPVLDEGQCCALIIYDVAKDAGEWDDTFKEYMIDVSKLIGNNLLVYWTEMENCSRDAVLADISHEIRTSMNTIVGMTETARAEYENKDQWMQCLKSIDKSVDHLVEVLKKLSDQTE